MPANTNDLARIHAAFASLAFVERWSCYLVDELGWEYPPEEMGRRFLEERADELVAHIEADPAAAAEWIINPDQSLSDEIDCLLRDEWIPHIYPRHPDARLPFESSSRTCRRFHATRATQGGPQSMTAADIAAYDIRMNERIRKHYEGKDAA